MSRGQGRPRKVIPAGVPLGSAQVRGSRRGREREVQAPQQQGARRLRGTPRRSCGSLLSRGPSGPAGGPQAGEIFTPQGPLTIHHQQENALHALVLIEHTIEHPDETVAEHSLKQIGLTFIQTIQVRLEAKRRDRQGTEKGREHNTLAGPPHSNHLDPQVGYTRCVCVCVCNQSRLLFPRSTPTQPSNGNMRVHIKYHRERFDIRPSTKALEAVRPVT